MSAAGGVQEAGSIQFPKREGDSSSGGSTLLSAAGSGVLATTSTTGVTTTSSAPLISTTNGGGDKEKAGKLHRGGLNKSFSRSGSFRNKHKLKSQDSSEMSSTAGGRGKSPGSPDTRTWKIRNFGYYDIQSVTVNRLSVQATGGSESRHQILRKPTGASAALLNSVADSEGEGSPSNDPSQPSTQSQGGDIGNELVAVCPAFRNEIGERGDWLLPQDIITKLRGSLSHEKRLRLCSREKIVLDGEFDESSNGPISVDTFTVQSGLTFPLEYIDYGACYYRNYFYDKG